MGKRVLVSEEVARHAVEVMNAADARIAELEAKLATAVGALEEARAAYGPWTGKTCKQERADAAIDQALASIQERT